MIRMKIQGTDVDVLCGDEAQLAALFARTARPQPQPPFAAEVLELLACLSDVLLHGAAAKAYPDVVTFAFFCRRAHLRQLAERYREAAETRIGRGLVFHIAPGNVPVNFAYTLVMGLLAGNVCVVKASSKPFAQTRIISAALARVLEEPEQAAMRERVFIVQYGREAQGVTEALSAICHARVIWGGDATIRRVREAALPPRAVEVTFADRYSFAVFSAAAVAATSREPKALQRLVQAFYNDTYLYDQNACTSPQLVVWLGTPDAAETARRAFWQAVQDEVRAYPVEPVVAVDKLFAVCRTAIAVPGAKFVAGEDNRVVRVTLPRLTQQLSELRAPGGLFKEFVAPSLDALADVVDEKWQTLVYYGLSADELRAFVRAHGLTGIDRIVHVGRSTEMGTVWDGQDFILSLSRIVSIL